MSIKLPLRTSLAGGPLSQGIAQVFPVFDVRLGDSVGCFVIIMGFAGCARSGVGVRITPQGIKRTETADAMPQADGKRTIVDLCR